MAEFKEGQSVKTRKGEIAIIDKVLLPCGALGNGRALLGRVLGPQGWYQGAWFANGVVRKSSPCDDDLMDPEPPLPDVLEAGVVWFLEEDGVIRAYAYRTYAQALHVAPRQRGTVVAAAEVLVKRGDPPVVVTPGDTAAFAASPIPTQGELSPQDPNATPIGAMNHPPNHTGGWALGDLSNATTTACQDETPIGEDNSPEGGRLSDQLKLIETAHGGITAGQRDALKALYYAGRGAMATGVNQSQALILLAMLGAKVHGQGGNPLHVGDFILIDGWLIQVKTIDDKENATGSNGESINLTRGA